MFLIRLMRWIIRGCLFAAIIFMSFHNQTIRKWALNNKYLNPIAKDLRGSEQAKNGAPTPKNAVRIYQDVKPRAKGGKTTSIQALPPLDHLGKEDQAALKKELENLHSKNPAKVGQK